MTTTMQTHADLKATAQGIIDNAIAAYTQIDQDEQHNLATITAHEETLQRLASSDSDASAHLATMQSHLEAVAQSYNEASSYAELAKDTPGERNAIKALKEAEKVRDEAQKALKLGQEAFSNTTRVNDEQRQTLTTESAGCHEQLQHLAHRRKHLSLGQTQAQQEIGDLTANEARERIEALKTAIAEKQHELTDLEASLQTAVSKESQRLTAWPVLALQVKNSIVHEDASTIVLEAALTYFDTLISHGKQCDVDDQIRTVLHYRELNELLTIPEHHLQHALNRYDHIAPREVMETRDNTQRVLDSYRQAHSKSL